MYHMSQVPYKRHQHNFLINLVNMSVARANKVYNNKASHVGWVQVCKDHVFRNLQPNSSGCPLVRQHSGPSRRVVALIAGSH